MPSYATNCPTVRFSGIFEKQFVRYFHIIPFSSTVCCHMAPGYLEKYSFASPPSLVSLYSDGRS